MLCAIQCSVCKSEAKRKKPESLFSLSSETPLCIWLVYLCKHFSLLICTPPVFSHIPLKHRIVSFAVPERLGVFLAFRCLFFIPDFWAPLSALTFSSSWGIPCWVVECFQIFLFTFSGHFLGLWIPSDFSESIIKMLQQKAKQWKSNSMTICASPRE